MALSKKEINRQRELMNYDYFHLYNVAKYGTGHHLGPIEKVIKEVRAGADPAEYGVLLENNQGKKILQRFSTFDRAEAAANQHNGRIVRLGRNLKTPYDSYDFSESQNYRPPQFSIDESGAIEFVEQLIEGDEDFNIVISLELTGLEAIQYKGTRPDAKALLELHKRHPEISFEDFAAAVIRHCEIPPYKEGGGENHKSSPWKSDDEKDEWYLTPAGQKWLKDNDVPPIMSHTKKEYFEWKSQEQSKL